MPAGTQPGLEAGAKTANTELRTLLLADFGLELYGNGIAATEDTIAKNPDVLGNLQAEVREKLIDFLQKEHPEALPRGRAALDITPPARDRLEPSNAQASAA